MEGETSEATMPSSRAPRQADARSLDRAAERLMLARRNQAGRGAIQRILLPGATVLTLDPRIGDVRADILVEGSRIVAVAPSIAAEDAEITPAERMIALPGFVDSPDLAIPVARRRDRLDPCPIFLGDSRRYGPPVAHAWRRLAADAGAPRRGA